MGKRQSEHQTVHGNKCYVDEHGSFPFNRLPFSFSSSVDGESSLQEYSGEREGDADLLYLHGEEQQEPLGPER